MKPHERVDEMMSRKVNLGRLEMPGTYDDLHTKLTRELAVEYEREKDLDYVSVSWPSQEKAQDYFNTHGFEDTLDHMLQLRMSNNCKQFFCGRASR